MKEYKTQIAKYILQVYSLVMCFVSSVIIMICAALLLTNSADLVFPNMTSGYRLNQFNSNPDYLDYLKNSDYQEKLKSCKKMKTEMLNQIREKHKEDFIEEKKGANIASILTCLAWIISALGLLGIHVIIHKKSRK